MNALQASVLPGLKNLPSITSGISKLTLPSIVEQNLTTALIIGDDVDWDTRLKSQLQIFALASRGLQALLSNASSHPDVTPDFTWLGERDAARRSFY
jgi:hypothetical protein